MPKQPEVLHRVNSFSQKQRTNSYLHSATIFILGLLVGWLLLGWVLFPVKAAPVTPADMQPDVVDDYLLMTAESYAETHNLRDAARRLRFWDDPKVLGPKLHDLANRVDQKTRPADIVYLHVLIDDLRLPDAEPQPAEASQKGSFNLMWLLIPLLALGVLAVLILIAQRFNLLTSEPPVPMPEQPELPETPAVPEPPSQVDDESPESPLFQSVEPTPLEEDVVVEVTADFGVEDDTTLDDAFKNLVAELEAMPDETPPEILDEDDEERSGPEALEDDFLLGDAPEFLGEEAQATPPEPDEEDLVPPNAFESPETTPVPLPPHPEDDYSAPQILIFDGSPTFNTIIAIETDDEYLGEYGLSANQTAPHNPELTLTLEAWLFDKTDTQTTELALVPPVLVHDPELKARYIKDDAPVLALQAGQTFVLETAELKVEGVIRQVVLGMTTRDGVPIIERAEIELNGYKKA